VLVGHPYGGMVITEAAAGNDAVVGLVYVVAFAPEQGESALQLSSRFPGSTLGDALVTSPVPTGALSSGSGRRRSTSSSSLTGRRPRPS
jgi:pimeloyl-ACP methyl ester carboxylesterase